MNDVAATSGHVGEYLVAPNRVVNAANGIEDGWRATNRVPRGPRLDAVDLLGFSIGSFVAQEN